MYALKNLRTSKTSEKKEKTSIALNVYTIIETGEVQIGTHREFQFNRDINKDLTISLVEYIQNEMKQVLSEKNLDMKGFYNAFKNEFSEFLIIPKYKSFLNFLQRNGFYEKAKITKLTKAQATLNRVDKSTNKKIKLKLPEIENIITLKATNLLSKTINEDNFNIVKEEMIKTRKSIQLLTSEELVNILIDINRNKG